MPLDFNYQKKYITSHALIVGINAYSNVSKLTNARQDAVEVANKLEECCGFERSNIKLLLDADATKLSLLRNFKSMAKDATHPDDRLFVFFAGHGHTETGHRGEVGYLVPVDGDSHDLDTLIRWDELTRDADLIRAKHVFFVVDACFGGLAVTRSANLGKSRFLSDMYLRMSRQVLAAGKADETVSDGSGPIPGHSIFTGHLLQGISGAASSDGVITATNLMSYVYNHVGKDQYSNQTPHFGQVDGDGDFILKADLPTMQIENDTTPKDILIESLMFPIGARNDRNQTTLEETTKDYLSDRTKLIRLDDLVTEELRNVLQVVGEQHLSASKVSLEISQLIKMVGSYEESLSRLCKLASLLAKWGQIEHQPLLKKIFSRLTDSVTRREGYTVLLGMQWYPVMFSMYHAGVAAISAENYESLASIFLARYSDRTSGKPSTEIVVPTIEGVSEMDRANIFKNIPNFERMYTPRSEYLFKVVQPNIEDLLFLGASYEDCFDTFEVFCALQFADIRHMNEMKRNKIEADKSRVWGPPGRFAWKSRSEDGDEIIQRLISEAQIAKENWAPLKAGMFMGSSARFLYIADRYQKDVLQKLNWY